MTSRKWQAARRAGAFTTPALLFSALMAAQGAVGCESPSTVDHVGICAPHARTCANPCDARGIQTVHRIESPVRTARAGDVTSPTLELGLLVTTAWSDTPPSRQAFDRWSGELLSATREVFGRCGVLVHVAHRELASVPAATLVVSANTPESWAGLAPEGEDAEQFNHALGERLTPEVSELFSFARRGLPDRALTITVVDQIHYYAARQRTRAGGLSFPPNVYHHRDDFPVRNGVLLSGTYTACGALPKQPPPRVVAHELGHMLLNQAHHEADSKNLMGPVSGPELTPAQCERIRANLTTLFGESPIADPGPPPPSVPGTIAPAHATQ